MTRRSNKRPSKDGCQSVEGRSGTELCSIGVKQFGWIALHPIHVTHDGTKRVWTLLARRICHCLSDHHGFWLWKCHYPLYGKIPGRRKVAGAILHVWNVPYSLLHHRSHCIPCRIGTLLQHRLAVW